MKIADLPEPFGPMKTVRGSNSTDAFFSDMKFSTSILWIIVHILLWESCSGSDLKTPPPMVRGKEIMLLACVMRRQADQSNNPVGTPQSLSFRICTLASADFATSFQRCSLVMILSRR